MSTDLKVVFARRRAAREQTRAHHTLLLACVTVALAVLVLLSVSPGFARGVQFLGEIGFWSRITVPRSCGPKVFLPKSKTVMRVTSVLP
jgi:hypothetical protein